MKNKLNLITVLTILLMATPAMAKDSKWQFGFTGGFATGVVMDDFFGIQQLVGARAAGDNWSIYNGADLMLSTAYQISPRTKIRFNLGVERIFNQASYSGMFGNHLTLVAEAAMLFHFIKQPKAFDPYLVTGVGFPTLPHIGLGNSFKINENTSMFVEVLGSSLLLHNRVDTRIGVMFRF